jgi:hypothetical protein
MNELLHGGGELGISKHRTSGHSPNIKHFTGKKSSKPVTRKGKGINKKERAQNRGSHVNKYAQP